MTNAHVVAGVSAPKVILEDGEVDAEVVYYNPDIDVAVLAVEGLGRPFLRFDREGESADARGGARLPRGRALRRPGRADPLRAAAPEPATSTARTPWSATCTPYAA